MNPYIFTIKRLFRSIGFPIFLLITAAAVFVSPLIGREESVPFAGIVDEDDSEISRKVVSALLGSNFVECENEELLREGIAGEAYTCGFVLPDGFGERLKTGELNESVKLITSPISFTPELYKSDAAAAVYSVYAPYITAEALEYMGIEAEEVASVYDELMKDGYLFSFDVVVGQTEITPENERARTYTISAGALFLFALLIYGSCDVTIRDGGSFSRRIGIHRTIRHILIPGIAVRALLTILVMCISLVLVRFVIGESFLNDLLIPIFIYILMLSGFSMLLSAIFRKPEHVQILSCFIVLIALVLCPIYFDITLTLSWTSALRYLLPPYWLWLCAEHPLACMVAALLMLSLSPVLVYLRWRRQIPVPLER